MISYYKGGLWCITSRRIHVVVTGWDYAEDHIWPDTDILYIVGIILSYIYSTSTSNVYHIYFRLPRLDHYLRWPS